MKQLAWVVAATSALVGTATAETEVAHRTARVVDGYVTLLESAAQDLSYVGKETASDCLDAIDVARKAGVTTLTDTGFKRVKGSVKHADSIEYDIPLASGEQVCKDYSVYVSVAPVRVALAEAVRLISMLTTDLMPGPDFVKGARAHVPKCNQAVDDVLAAKVPATFEFRLNNKSWVVGELKAKVCDELGRRVDQFSKDAAELDKKAEEKFTKYGIKGDKLELMRKYDGGLYLIGGAAPRDLKKYAAASVLFVWLTSDPDDAGFVTHTVRRHAFSGNKLVKTTEKTYRKRKGDKLGNVFN